MIRQCLEEGRDVLSGQRTCLHVVVQLKLFHQVNAILSRYFSLVLQVDSVANQVNDYVSVGIALDLCLPIASIFVWELGCDIVHDDDSIWSFIEDASYAPVGFLSSRVPYLELYDVLVIYPEHIVAELYSYCHIMVLMEDILGQSEQNRWLSNAYRALPWCY